MLDAFGIGIPENLREGVDPRRCALLVYDMQIGVVEQISDGYRMVEQCKRILDTARKQQFRIFSLAT